MIRDALDIMNPRARYTARGVLYQARPEVRAEGVEFSYEYVSAYSSAYRRLFGNLQGETGEVAIKTNDSLDFKVNRSYVVLSGGQLYKVAGVEKDYQAAPPQVLRMFGAPVSTVYMLRLVLEEDAWL